MPWGDREGGQLVWCDKSRTQGIQCQKWVPWMTLTREDRSTWAKKREMKLYQSDAKEGKCDSTTVSSVEILFFEKAARAYYHNHINIAYLLCYVNQTSK